MSTGNRDASRSVSGVDRVWDASIRVLSAATDRLEPLANEEVVSRAAAGLISLEAAVRRVVRSPRDVVARAYGLARNRDVDHLREEFEALTDRVDGRASARSPHRASVTWREGGEGPPVLLLNGWSASGIVWPSAFVRQLEQHHRVIRPDNRGTGWSRRAEVPFTVADQADDAATVLREARVSSAIVVGLSMGGMVAQELALRHPALVERLVVVASRPPAPAFVTSGPGFLTSTLRSPGGRSASTHIRELWAEHCAPGFAVENPDSMDELVGQILRRPTPRTTLLQQVRSMAAWCGPDRIRSITAPTTVVHGDVDPVVPVANGMRLAHLIPDAEYVELEGVGHLVPLEAGEQLIRVIDRVGAPTTLRAGV